MNLCLVEASPASLCWGSRLFSLSATVMGRSENLSGGGTQKSERRRIFQECNKHFKHKVD
jgi:hypothetical protein